MPCSTNLSETLTGVRGDGQSDGNLMTGSNLTRQRAMGLTSTARSRFEQHDGPLRTTSPAPAQENGAPDAQVSPVPTAVTWSTRRAPQVGVHLTWQQAEPRARVSTVSLAVPRRYLDVRP
jgi:hypothetical protein